MKKTTVLLLTALFALVLSDRAEGRPKRVGQIPNGEVNRCANCHVNPAGGGARNDFGRMVEDEFLSAAGFSGNVLWQSDLPFLDADGDGVSNGEELGDPNGAWQLGDELDFEVLVSLPGDAKSVPESEDPDDFDRGPDGWPHAVSTEYDIPGWGYYVVEHAANEWGFQIIELDADGNFLQAFEDFALIGDDEFSLEVISGTNPEYVGSRFSIKPSEIDIEFPWEFRIVCPKTADSEILERANFADRGPDGWPHAVSTEYDIPGWGYYVVEHAANEWGFQIIELDADGNFLQAFEDFALIGDDEFSLEVISGTNPEYVGSRFSIKPSEIDIEFPWEFRIVCPKTADSEILERANFADGRDPDDFDRGPEEDSDDFDGDERLKWADAAFQLQGSQEDYDRVMDSDNPEHEFYAIQDELGLGGDRGLFGPDLEEIRGTVGEFDLLNGVLRLASTPMRIAEEAVFLDGSTGESLGSDDLEIGQWLYVRVLWSHAGGRPEPIIIEAVRNGDPPPNAPVQWVEVGGWVEKDGERALLVAGRELLVAFDAPVFLGPEATEIDQADIQSGARVALGVRYDEFGEAVVAVHINPPRPPDRHPDGSTWDMVSRIYDIDAHYRYMRFENWPQAIDEDTEFFDAFGFEIGPEDLFPGDALVLWVDRSRKIPTVSELSLPACKACLRASMAAEARGLHAEQLEKEEAAQLSHGDELRTAAPDSPHGS